MAKFDGKFLKGTVGNTTLKKWRNLQVVQSKPVKVKQTEATQKAASLFGKASRLSKIIRGGIGPALFYDGTMINRFNTENAEILRQCFNQETKEFVFSEDIFKRLEGFEFNNASQLKNYLWVRPEAAISGHSLQVSLPEIKMPEELHFPGSANICMLRIAVGVYALKAGYQREIQYATLDMENSTATLPAKEWSFEIAEDCLAVVSFELMYYKKLGNIQNAMNSKSLNPSAICAALYNPGTFTMPEQADPGKIKTIWQFDDLQLI